MLLLIELDIDLVMYSLWDILYKLDEWEDFWCVYFLENEYYYLFSWDVKVDEVVFVWFVLV